MKPLTIMVTASGAPGTAALLRALRENGEREVRLVGTDMSDQAIGRHLADAFHVVPAGSDPGFADAMLEVARSEGADALRPAVLEHGVREAGIRPCRDEVERVAEVPADGAFGHVRSDEPHLPLAVLTQRAQEGRGSRRA